MAVPPSYSDLGKAAKDIFSKGYGESSLTFESTQKCMPQSSGLNHCCKMQQLLHSAGWPAGGSRVHSKPVLRLNNTRRRRSCGQILTLQAEILQNIQLNSPGIDG